MVDETDCEPPLSLSVINFYFTLIKFDGVCCIFTMTLNTDYWKMYYQLPST